MYAEWGDVWCHVDPGPIRCFDVIGLAVLFVRLKCFDTCPQINSYSKVFWHLSPYVYYSFSSSAAEI